LSYIGAKPTIGNFQICDAISVVNGQAAYTMQVGSVNVIPQSSNHMIVSLNGVIQKPGGANPSFTVSGSTITFASNLATGDVINFIQILGDVLDLGVPSDATVTDAKANFVSTSSAAGLQIKGDGTTDGTLQLNCSQNSHGIKLKSPPHSASASYTLTFPNNDGDANQVLTTDGSGVLTWASAGGVNTPSFSARLSSSLTLPDATNTDVVFQTEFFDVGSCYNASTGVFTVPSGEGGKYFFSTNCYFLDGNGNVSDMLIYMHTSIGGSASQDEVARAEATSNGTLFTRRTLSYSTIISLSAGDTVKIQVYADTNNGSGTSLYHGARTSVFSGFKIIE